VKPRYIILLFVVLMVSKMRAQYDPVFSHYFDMEPSFNAASVGKMSQLNIDVAYALSLAGFENNPKTMYASADMPFYFLKMYHGAGLQLLNDQIGLFRHQRLQGQYAAKFKLFGGMMSVGVQAGLLSENFDGSKLDLADSNDPAFATTNVNGNTLDLGAGIYYLRGPLYAGVSVQHATAPTVSLGETNEIKIDPTYYFTGGYNIKLRNPFLTIKSSVLARTDFVGFRADITGRLVYSLDKKMMYLGLGYSPTNSVTLLVGGKVHGVMLGYSYEYYTGGISFINGSHELFIGYQMDINLVKKGKNKHKSVRIL
jgi:type IX secretion system PorP/SprF family membrane protein